MIILYDFETSLPGRSLSLFAWRVSHTLPMNTHRWALNVKGLECKTEWLKYATIEQQLKERGIAHTEIRPDGTKRYTVPAILDTSTNTTHSDSHKIIEYLDAAYPNTPQLCTPVEGTMDDFIKPAFEANWGLPLSVLDSQWCLRISVLIGGLEEDSATRYRRNFEREVGTSLQDFLEDEERIEALWAETREAFRKVDAWLKEAEERYGAKSPWILGKNVKLPDLALISAVTWAVVSGGEDNAVWRRIATWDDGRWAKLWERIKSYSKVH